MYIAQQIPEPWAETFQMTWTGYVLDANRYKGLLVFDMSFISTTIDTVSPRIFTDLQTVVIWNK